GARPRAGGPPRGGARGGGPGGPPPGRTRRSTACGAGVCDGGGTSWLETRRVGRGSSVARPRRIPRRRRKAWGFRSIMIASSAWIGFAPTLPDTPSVGPDPALSTRLGLIRLGQLDPTAERLRLAVLVPHGRRHAEPAPGSVAEQREPVAGAVPGDQVVAALRRRVHRPAHHLHALEQRPGALEPHVPLEPRVAAGRQR